MLRPYNFVPFASLLVNPAFPDPTAASPIDLGELFLILIQLLVTINIGNGGTYEFSFNDVDFTELVDHDSCDWRGVGVGPS
jgi:hypothetical protein